MTDEEIQSVCEDLWVIEPGYLDKLVEEGHACQNNRMLGGAHHVPGLRLSIDGLVGRMAAGHTIESIAEEAGVEEAYLRLLAEKAKAWRDAND